MLGARRPRLAWPIICHYIKSSEIEWDNAKDAENLVKHRLSLSAFVGFDEEAAVSIDERYDYGEVRYRAFGRIDGIGHCLVFTIRDNKRRLISFRRARDKEMRRNE